MPKEIFGMLGVFALLLFSGCGDGKIGVSGTISYDGKVLQRGMIGFVSEEGRGSNYDTNFTGGKYRIRVPEGRYMIRCSGGQEMVKLDKPIPGGMGTKEITELPRSVIPEHYMMGSKIFVDVNANSRVHHIELPKPEKRIDSPFPDSKR